VISKLLITFQYTCLQWYFSKDSRFRNAVPACVLGNNFWNAVPAWVILGNTFWNGIPTRSVTKYPCVCLTDLSNFSCGEWAGVFLELWWTASCWYWEACGYQPVGRRVVDEWLPSRPAKPGMGKLSCGRAKWKKVKCHVGQLNLL
jgi:hypothetical protein